MSEEPGGPAPRAFVGGAPAAASAPDRATPKRAGPPRRAPSGSTGSSRPRQCGAAARQRPRSGPNRSRRPTRRATRRPSGSPRLRRTAFRLQALKRAPLRPVRRRPGERIREDERGELAERGVGVVVVRDPSPHDGGDARRRGHEGQPDAGRVRVSLERARRLRHSLVDGAAPRVAPITCGRSTMLDTAR